MNKALKLITIGLLFFAPIIVLIYRYSNTQIVEVTERSMPLWVLFITSLLALIFIFWLFSQTMAKIKQSPFGWGSLLFFGGLTIVTLIMSYLWAVKFEDLVVYKTAELLKDVAYFKTTLQIIAPFTMLGLGIIAFHFIRQINK